MVNGSRAKIRRGQAVKAIFRRSKILTPVAALDTAPMGVTPAVIGGRGGRDEDEQLALLDVTPIADALRKH